MYDLYPKPPMGNQRDRAGIAFGFKAHCRNNGFSTRVHPNRCIQAVFIV